MNNIRECRCSNSLLAAENDFTCCIKCKSLYIDAQKIAEITGFFELMTPDKSKIASINREKCRCGSLYTIVHVKGMDFHACPNCSEILIAPENVTEPGALIIRANIFSELGMTWYAFEDYEKSILMVPSFQAFYNMGVMLSKQEKYEEAAESYKCAAEINPESHVCWYNYGDSLLKLKRYDAAIHAFTQAIQISPLYADAFYSRGLSHRGKNDFRRALLDFSRAVMLNPADNMALLHRGMVHFIMKNYESACSDFDLVVRDNPGCGLAWQMLGELFWNSDKIFSVKCFEKAYTLKDTLPDRGVRAGMMIGADISVKYA